MSVAMSIALLGGSIATATAAPSGTEMTSYYLGGGSANSVAGAGTLALAPEAATGSDEFKFNPAHPVPTIGGNLCCSVDLMPGGAFDQRPVERRWDVLVYTSTPMTRALAVIGNPSVALMAQTTAPRTMFTAKLVDVHPDGYAQLITDGVISARSKSAGGPAAYTIRLSPTATVFKPGHRIRLEISSSSYPRFAVNPLTATDAPFAVAMQTIYWGRKSPSRLELPVAAISIPAEQ